MSDNMCESNQPEDQHLPPSDIEGILREHEKLLTEQRAYWDKQIRCAAPFVALACGTCGRHPTICEDGAHILLIVCPHVGKAFRESARAIEVTGATKRKLLQGYMRIETWDDGPARW